MFSASVFPTGMDHLCPLVGGYVVLVGVFLPGVVGLGVLVGGFHFSSDVFRQKCSSFLSHGERLVGANSVK